MDSVHQDRRERQIAMILGQISFGPSGKFEYGIEPDMLKKATDAIVKFVMQADENALLTANIAKHYAAND